MKLIYGSTAIKHWFPDFPREPSDLDYILSEYTEEYESTREIQHYYIPEFKEVFNINVDEKYIDPDLLYTFKVSHAAWDIRWEKTMKDIEFLKTKGCKLNYKIYKLLYERWSISYGKKHVNMDVYNDEFFKENIYREYSHDDLHEVFKFYKRPLNEAIRDDLNSPRCNPLLWEELFEHDKLKCTLEELFVLTTERYILVENPMPSKTARVKMLKQMIISTTSGWFCLYIILNFELLRTAYQEQFDEKLKQLQRTNL